MVIFDDDEEERQGTDCVFKGVWQGAGSYPNLSESEFTGTSKLIPTDHSEYIRS